MATDGLSGTKARVDQAQRMISCQARCTVAEALTLMTDRGQVNHQTLDEIAVAVVERLIRFG